jgi:hypothetical protein
MPVIHLKTEPRAKRTLQKVDLVVRRVLKLAERCKARTVLEVNLQFVVAYRAERVAEDCD